MKKLIFVLFLTGCSFAGTGTGNPRSDFSNSSGDATQLMIMVDKMCEKISSCHSGTTKGGCWDAVSAMTEYAPKLGATETPAPTLSTLVWADYGGTRRADFAAVEACQTQVEALTCADSEVQNAFDSNLANPFANSAEMMAPECSRIFEP